MSLRVRRTPPATCSVRQSMHQPVSYDSILLCAPTTGSPPWGGQLFPDSPLATQLPPQAPGPPLGPLGASSGHQRLWLRRAPAGRQDGPGWPKTFQDDIQGGHPLGLQDAPVGLPRDPQKRPPREPTPQKQFRFFSYCLISRFSLSDGFGSASNGPEARDGPTTSKKSPTRLLAGPKAFKAALTGRSSRDPYTPS